jgi:hypothetical protein
VMPDRECSTPILMLDRADEYCLHIKTLPTSRTIRRIRETRIV